MIHSINYARQVISAKIGSGINWLAPPENRIISPLTSIIKSAIKFYWAFHCNIQRGIKDILWRYVHWLIKKFSFDNMGRSTVFYHYWDKRWLKVHWKIWFHEFFVDHYHKRRNNDKTTKPCKWHKTEVIWNYN